MHKQPSQPLDEAPDFHLDPLDINAMPGAEAQEELDAAVELGDSGEDELDPDELTVDERTAKADDVGELYGVHISRAEMPERGAGPELGQYAKADLGENWLETLETDAVEGGPIAESEVDANDESDRAHGSESGDRPVADKGSGGPAGL